MLGLGAFGAIALADVFWNLAAAIILGVPVGSWLLKQLWGELQLERECRKPVQVEWSGEQVIQDVPALPVAPRRAIGPTRRRIEPPPPRVPIIAQAEVIEVKRA